MPLLSGYLKQARTKMVTEHARGDVLDVGCQKGQLFSEIEHQITSYTGVDILEDLIEDARAAVPKGSFSVCNIDIDALEYENAFDTVIMCAIVEHVFNQRFAFEGIRRALKPGGRIIITTPTPLGNDVVHSIGAAIGLFYQSAQDDHIVIYNRKRFQVLAQEVGLTLESHRYFQLGCNQLAILSRPSA